MADLGAELLCDGQLAKPRQGMTSRRLAWPFWLARGLLILYVVFLFWLATESLQVELSPQSEDLSRFSDWPARVLAAQAAIAVQFLVLGLLLAVSAGPLRTSSGLLGRAMRWLGVSLVGLCLHLMLSTASMGWPILSISAVCPLAGCMAGAWIGIASLRGRRAMFWLAPQLGMAALAVGGLAAGVVFLAVDEEPLAFQPPEITSAEKRRLADVLEHSRRVGKGRRQLVLAGQDVNSILAMAAAHAPWEGKAKVAFGQGRLKGDLSVKASDFCPLSGYINVRLACRGILTDGRPKIHLESCHVGRLRLPKFMLDEVSTLVTSTILEDPDLRKTVAPLDRVRVAPDGVEIVFRSGEISGRTIASLIARLGGKPDIASRTRVYYRHLVEEARTLPEDDRFQAFLQAAFELAQQRSRDEDPVLENRAAILALAILLGHWRVETLVGPVTDHDLRATARRRVGRVTLRGRRDWCQHFLVSAALALLSNESLSDGGGLTKEELDAGENGSGFSFSDLLADRAGTLFALAATESHQRARQMQNRLAGGFEVDEVFPAAADLPERISALELETKYGGVGGSDYRAVIQGIERRLAACAALQ